MNHSMSSNRKTKLFKRIAGEGEVWCYYLLGNIEVRSASEYAKPSIAFSMEKFLATNLVVYFLLSSFNLFRFPF